MATQAERRILHITTDKLENVQDTQIAFENFRDEAGLSYFGGAFGGKYASDPNKGPWDEEGAISRFARYNSNPVFRSVIFNNYDGSDTGFYYRNITLTTVAELEVLHDSEANGTTNPTPNEIGFRGVRSINIGDLAGQNVEGDTNGNYGSINIGFNAARFASSANSISIGRGAGNNSTGGYLIMIGENAGFSASGDQNIMIGDNTQATGDVTNCTLIGSQAKSQGGRGQVLVGDRTGFDASPGWHQIFMGSGAGNNSLGNEVCTYIGVEAGAYSVNGYANVAMGQTAGHGVHNIYGVSIGPDAGAWEYPEGNPSGSLGRNFFNMASVSVGWESGFNAEAVENTFMGDFSDANDRVGYRVPYFEWNGSPVVDSEGQYYGPHVGFNTNLGPFAGNSARGATNINIGFGAGGFNTPDTGNKRNIGCISIGANSGQKTNGIYNIFLGAVAGHSFLGSDSIFIGNQAGYNYRDLTDSNLFELANTPISETPTNERILLNGNFAQSWIRAENVFGLGRYDTTNMNGYATPFSGAMVYNTTENEPYYYNGTGWVAMAGSSGVTEFKSLTDVTSTNGSGDYGYSKSLVMTNAGANGITYAGINAFGNGISSTDVGLTFEVNQSAGSTIKIGNTGTTGGAPGTALDIVKSSVNGKWVAKYANGTTIADIDDIGNLALVTKDYLGTYVSANSVNANYVSTYVDDNSVNNLQEALDNGDTASNSQIILRDSSDSNYRTEFGKDGVSILDSGTPTEPIAWLRNDGLTCYRSSYNTLSIKADIVNNVWDVRGKLQYIENVTPTNDMDVATKKYVDDTISESNDKLVIPTLDGTNSTLSALVDGFGNIINDCGLVIGVGTGTTDIVTFGLVNVNVFNDSGSTIPVAQLQALNGQELVCVNTGSQVDVSFSPNLQGSNQVAGRIHDASLLTASSDWVDGTYLNLQVNIRIGREFN